MADSSNINQKDRTEYLVLRKFPFARSQAFPPSLNASSRPRLRLPDVTPQLREALDAYRAELAALSNEEIIERYNAEKQREFQQAVAKSEREERERFYNQPHATADFQHWSKLAHWTLDEAVALSFGKAPELVNWPTISKYLQISSFAVEYSRRRELAVRAVLWKQVYDPVLPGIFLAWAKGLDIEVPAALVEAVQKRGPIRDWKSLFDDLKTAHAQEKASWTALDEAKDRTIAAKSEVVAALEERVCHLQTQQNAQPPGKHLSARERESLLKIIVGMAIGGYSYDPKAGRSDRPSEIASDLARAGVPLDVDTVRKWLREAGELLPPKEN